MPNPPHQPARLDDRIEELFLRYNDLVTSQADALEAGDLPRATQIAGVAEGILLDCQRLKRIIPPGNAGLDGKIEKLASTAAASAAQIGALLESRRKQLLAELRSIETTALGPAAGTQQRPNLINIRT